MSRLNGILRRGSADLLGAHAASMQLAIDDKSPSIAVSENELRGVFSAGQIAANPHFVVAFDGSIFNRAEFGDAFANDAEALLLLLEAYGIVEALQRLNGDFALVIFDQRKQALYLARDRFGLKPLYYCKVAGGWAFSSRPRALLTLPGVSADVNTEFVALFAGSHYRTFDNAPDKSPFKAIAQLPAAHYCVVQGNKVETHRYWMLRGEPDFELSEAALAEQYRALLSDSVAIRVKRARVPVFTLSGGMDSSSVLASAVKSSGEKQPAISTVYIDKTYDESDEIRSMLDQTVAQWHTVEIGSPDVFALVEEMIGCHDEPVATATWLSHYIMCREASRLGFGSFFGGLGGDELNAGEYEHFFYFFADLRVSGLTQRYDEEVRMWAHYHDHPIFRKSPAVAQTQLARVVDLKNPGVCLPDQTRIARYAKALNRDYFDLGSFAPVMEHPFQSYLKNRTYQDMTRETVPCCLRAEDRQTAAYGMDNFLPFFDHRLVEFMFRVPSMLKYKQGVTKSLLREAMRGVLPEETRARVKKTGWNAPAHRWFSGEGRTKLLELLHSQSFRERGIYDIPEVLRLLDEHERITMDGLPVDNHMMFFWQLVNLELWFRWVDAPASARIGAAA
jgi:asparagine synthase (glutamine-hydrolysing)